MDNWQAFVPLNRGPGDQPELAADNPPDSATVGPLESAADVQAEPASALSLGAEERTRTLSLIDFLADYDARKNPSVYDIRRYELFLLRDAEVPGVPGVNLSPAAQAWLTVDFLDLPPRPAVPDDLVGLLGETADISPHVRPEVRTTTDGAEPQENGTAPDPELVLAAEAWIGNVWEPFAARWAEVSAAKTLHRDLFLQRELLARDRESVELVWGFGRLRWEAQSAVLDHPLITIPVEVEQDDATQRIRVCAAGAPEIEARCMAGLSLADRAGFMNIRQSVNDNGLDPWDGPSLESVLRPLVRAVDHEGMLVDRAPLPGPAAVVDQSWVLFMRRRQPDYLGFLDRMRALYRDESVVVPDTLQAIVSDTPSALTGPTIGAGDGSGAVNEVEPLLLPLPTNEEQQRILARAQHSTGVTVQGPPGTGKSHTIANIISHYVAYGKRVLVVAEKEQALRALNTKIPAGIKDLTVSVLGADAESRRELESAIGQIQTRVTGIDKGFAAERIKHLNADLDEVNRRIATTTQALLRTREAEVECLPGSWGPGATPTRAEAARWVAENAAAFDYIDDPITPEVARPISGGELAEFVTLIGQVGVSRADACAADLPTLAGVPTAQDLDHHLTRLAELQTSVRSLGDAVHDWDRAVAAGHDGLQALAARCHAEMEWMAKTAGTWLSHVREQVGDVLLARDWASFGARVSQGREEVLRLRAALTAHQVEVPAIQEPTFVDGLRQARDRLAQGGKLGMFAGPAKRAVAECVVDGRQPSTAEEIGLCLRAVEVEGLRREMLTSWRNQLSRVGGAELSAAAPEDVLGPLLEELRRALHWPRAWAQLRHDLAMAGISSPAGGDADALGSLEEICIRARDQIEVRELSQAVQRLDEWLRTGAASATASPLWNLLADAVSRHDISQWQHLRAELTALHEFAPAAWRLRETGAKLSACAPIWTARILADPSAAGDPADFEAAWQWRQLDSWIGAALAGQTPARLQARLEELSKERRRVVAELVSERAWCRLADNLGDRQRQALNSYVRAVTRFGKTGGRFAQRWLNEIRIALDESKDAVPVWIMPTARALSSFRPEREPPFDVLVVDEASQIGLEAVPLLALARRTIVVGDDKQTSPENVGLNRQAVFDLLDEHLAAVPKYRTLFDPDGSLYDIAFQKFPGVVMLTEHFRCLPPIIAFSNAHAYNNRIIPLRDQPPHPGWAALGAVKVLDGYRKGMVNEPEADAVVDLVGELCANPDYDGMTMGVISLLGSSQSKLIWDKLYDRIGPEVMTQRDLRSGEPANFQGDERAVIIISTVVAVDPANPSGRVAAMTSNAAMRRINVAASRAQQQMWVVHSLDRDRFADDDLRGALIRHCRDAGTTTAPSDDLLNACESQFERDVLRKIIARGYRKVFVQHHVGRYRIDIVVEGPDSRLAVECDGDRWHGPDVWHRDRARQEVLERANWTFERIRGSAFYRDPDAALLPLWQRLADLGIPTGDWWSTETSHPVVREVSGAGLNPNPTERADVTDRGNQPQLEATALDADAATATTSATVPGPLTSSPKPIISSRETGGAEEAEGAEPSSVAPPVPATETPPPPHPPVNNRIGPSLLTYQAWPPHPLPHPDSTAPSQLVTGLVEIVAVQGPMHAQHAYRVYTQAAGGQRVGAEIRRALETAARNALRTGALRQLKDDLLLPHDKTLYAASQPPVLLRELGMRQLSDVPRSEVVELIKQLNLENSSADVVKRAVLNAYGLIRLTPKASLYLDECLSYRWRE